MLPVSCSTYRVPRNLRIDIKDRLEEYIDSSCSVDHINCSLLIPINRQMQSDGVSDVYFDVAVILSK